MVKKFARTTGLLACAAILYMLWSGREKRAKHGFAQRPIWADVVLAAIGCGVSIGAVLLVNAYPWPIGIVTQYAAAHGITVPPGPRAPVGTCALRQRASAKTCILYRSLIGLKPPFMSP